MTTKYHSLKHPRKISSVTDGEIAIYGSSDGVVWHPIKVDANGRLSVVTGLVPEAYDHIELSHTGSNLTGVVYRTGGASGTVVATLTLAYTGDVLDSVTKT